MMFDTEDPNDDLINFNINSPTSINANEIIERTHQHENVKNLLDTELPELEQKLQTTISLNSNFSLLKNTSVDIEDILIRIDEEDEENLSKERNASEALRILESLDEILNEHLTFTDDNNCENNDHFLDVVTQKSIEECLEELDEYLRSLDESDDNNENVEDDEEDDEHENIPKKNLNVPSIPKSQPSPSQELPLSRTESRASLRIKLKTLEENYNKYLTLKKTNLLKETIKNDVNLDEIRSKSLNSCYNDKSEIWRRIIRSQFVNALVTLPIRKKIRPKLSTENVFAREELHQHNISKTDVDKKQQQNQHQNAVQSERLAHASGVCCTGTVVVETQRESSNQTGNSCCSFEIEHDDELQFDHPKDDEQHHPSSNINNNSWMRTSMRHLRRLRLPSNSNDNRDSTEISANSVDREIRRSVSDNVRPFSAPTRLEDENSRSRSRLSAVSNNDPDQLSGCVDTRNSSISTISRRRQERSNSPSETSLESSSLETDAGTVSSAHAHSTIGANNTTSGRITCDRNSGSTNNRQNDMPEASSPLGQWPHSLSSTLACLSCSLGLFNISRFAILTIHFGFNFVLQFMILSIVFGLPLFTLQMCLGQQLGAGVIDMWRISPLFQGVGVSLFLSQALIGVYSIIGVSWMFVFFRDSFITRTDKYKWTEPFIYYRNSHFSSYNQYNNNTSKLQETIPDYFNGIVLQRHHLSSGTEYGTIKFQMAFNLAVVWMIVFVCLSKGLKSYGKVIYVFTLVPVFGMFILSAKILGMIPPNFINSIVPEMYWDEFFINSRSWLAAAQEAFLTWGLLGAAVMQITSHNKEKRLLQRDSSLVAVITFIVLILVAFLANTCVQILKAGGYNYTPSSFERMNSYVFLRSQNEPLPPSLGNTPIRYMTHNSFIIGEKTLRPFMDPTSESGYQVLRFGTELIPATFAVLGSERISSFWAVLFYFILILFGIAQQLAIWHCVITGIMAIKAKVLKSWETTITFFSCSFGFLLGLPMATELGIYVVYVLDYTVGGLWWLLMIIFLQIVAVFMVRGRPYSGDNVVTALFSTNGQTSCLISWIPSILSFIWNVILPVGLVVLCILTFKNGHFKEMFIWHHAPIVEYWPLVVRQIGSLLQLLPILCVPIVAVIQSYRYLNNGPSDILERIQMLYRPPIGEHMDDLTIQEAAAASRTNNNNINNVISEDPPPKYTPPPSYTTATGARIAKFLRQSIRRSVRRIANVLGESSSNNTFRQRSVITQTQLPPPDYSTVLVEMNRNIPTISSQTEGNNNTDLVNNPTSQIRVSTLERLRNLQPLPGSSHITAAEVACILRNSFRRSTVRRNRHVIIDSSNQTYDNTMASLSAENLIDSAAPIGETSLIVVDRLPDMNEESDDKTTTVI